MCDFTHEFVKSRFKAQIVVALADHCHVPVPANPKINKDMDYRFT